MTRYGPRRRRETQTLLSSQLPVVRSSFKLNARLVPLAGPAALNCPPTISAASRRGKAGRKRSAGVPPAAAGCVILGGACSGGFHASGAGVAAAGGIARGASLVSRRRHGLAVEEAEDRRRQARRFPEASARRGAVQAHP